MNAFNNENDIDIDYSWQASKDDQGVMSKRKIEKATCEIKSKLLTDECNDTELMEIIHIMQMIAIYCIEEEPLYNNTKSQFSYSKDVSRVIDIAKYHSPLIYPYFVTDVPDFITTLDSLYQWKNHQI